MNEIAQFITVERGGRTQRRGVLVAEKVNGMPIVGWSLCHLGKDEFDRDMALTIARERIRLVGEDSQRAERHEIPHSVQKYMPHFVRRCERYFKSKPVVFGRPATD